MKNIINFIVKEEDNNRRVDMILANHDKSLSRTRVKNLILDSKLKINERVVQDPSIKTKLNDKIELEIVEPKKQSLKPYDFKLNIIGLMCIPPFDKNSKTYFVKMRELSENLNLKDISMGMSDDYMEAIKQGSTFIRIGSKIFGARG